jgi:toxin ParE1/3/4
MQLTLKACVNACIKLKPIVPRELANHDVDAIVDYCLEKSAEQAALGFIDALEVAYSHIARDPATGSPRYAQALNLPGLRFWPLTRYPHLVFYLERPDHIDIWRVLHGKQDIPQWMRSAE